MEFEQKSIVFRLVVILILGAFSGCSSNMQQRVDGILKSFFGNLLSISSATGKDLIFNASPAVVQTTIGMQPGDDIVIIHTWKNKGTDITGAGASAIQNKAEHDADPEQKGFTGTLISSSMNTITAKDASGFRSPS